jgi:transcriptional regulator with AAA-type ATPase domain
VGAAGSNETLSLAGDEGGEQERAGAYLFLALTASRLAAPPARINLAGIDEILVGRGDRAISLEGRRLVVRAEDAWMSSTHARFLRAAGGWILEDAGSKNGSLVDGRATRRAALDEGSLVELGHTFFLLRAGLPVEAGEPIVCDAASSPPPAPGFATISPALERVLARLPAVARAGIPVLIEGETGTGKEVAARALHALSGRGGDFVAVNCGALPASLLEDALFGHKRGAFSGASEDRPGLVRASDGGTLFLDEIGELPAPAQAALLRALDQREVLPVGATRPVPVDLRVVAATHRPLARMVEAGGFRRDLYMRLAGYRVALPKLSERREDLGLLAGALLARLGPEVAARAAMQPKAARALFACAWPGNVRQLEKCLSAAVAVAGGGVIGIDHLPEEVRAAPPSLRATALDEEDAAQRERLIALLGEHQGNVSAVARALGKARMQVQRWMKRYGIDPEAFRSD